MNLRAAIRERMEETSILTLAIQDEQGPWSVPVIFAYEETPAGFVLYFMSRTDTRHARAIQHSPWVAASLHPGTTRPLRGLQMEGPVHPVSLQELPRVLHLYGQRFPRALPRIPRDLLHAGKLRFFTFHPHRIGVLDEQRFGWGIRKFWEAG